MVSTAGVVLAGKIGGDNVTVASAGAFSDAAAGANKTVRLSNAYGGADLGNYLIVDQATTLASIAAVPVTPVPPVTPVVPVAPVAPASPAAPVTPGTPAAPSIAASDQVRDAIVQVQSTILAPQASAQPQSLNPASTVVDVGNEAAPALINTRFGAGPNAPTLQIQDGGVHLPPLASNSPR